MDEKIHTITPAMIEAMEPRTPSQVRLVLVRGALTAEWQTTPEIARGLGVEWAPGSHGDLVAVRDDLYRLYVQGIAEVDETARPLKWRKS